MALLLLASCMNEDKRRVAQNIKSMLGDTIVVPEDMIIYNQTGNKIKGFDSTKEHIIVYFSANYCPECNIWKIEEWQDLERDFDRIQIVYVVSSNEKSIKSIEAELGTITPQNSLIFLDLNDSFMARNPFINDNPVYHVFWADSNNVIKIVGDPFYNQQTYEFYKRYYNEGWLSTNR